MKIFVISTLVKVNRQRDWRNLITAFIGTFLFMNISAQHSTVTSVLSKCQAYYSSRPALKFEMYYKMYDSYTSANLIQEIDGSVVISNGNVQIKLGEQTQLLTDRYAIVADGATKTLAVQERTNKKQHTPLGLDSLIGLFGETKVVNETDQLITLSFAKPKASFYAISKFTVDFHKETGRVEAAVLYYLFDLNQFYEEYQVQTIPRIEILYRNYSEGNIESNSFSESTFFQVDNNVLKPTNTYKTYRLLDLRTLKKIN